MFEFPPEEGFDVEIIPVTRTVIYNSNSEIFLFCFRVVSRQPLRIFCLGYLP